MAEFQISTAALMQNEEHFTQLQGALLEGFSCPRCGPATGRGPARRRAA